MARPLAFLRPALARYGEFLATRFLVNKGYKIVATNWTIKQGELDIVAARGSILVFIEVKTRRSTTSDDFPPADAVDERKMERIRRLSGIYLDRNEKLLKILRTESVRYDVIGVSVRRFGQAVIEHRPGAFD